MKAILRMMPFPVSLALAFAAGMSFEQSERIPSRLMSPKEAPVEEYEWGTFRRYYDEATTFGTRDTLVAEAVIKPGYETHPPHQHVQEEFMMVTEGEGIMYLKGKEIPTRKGDMLYTSPWDWHGIKNTGTEPMKFVVFKWNGRGIDLLPQPKQDD